MTGRMTVILVATILFVVTPLTAHAQDRVALVNAIVIDGRGQSAVPGQVILIEDGKIAAMYRVGEREPPDGTRTIDIGGQFVVPGLIDGHLHFTPNRKGAADGLGKMLRAGITTVRDLAGDARIAQRLAAQGDANPGTLPDIVYSAVLWGPQFLRDPRSAKSAGDLEPGTAPWSRVVTDTSDLPSIVAEAKVFGATGLKLYASISPDLLQRLVAQARAQGLRSWSHSVVFPSNVTDVIAAAPHEIIHAKGFISAGKNDLPDNFTDGVPGWVRKQDYAGTDPDGPRFRELFAKMIAAGTILQPALVADGDMRRGPLPHWVASMRPWSCQLTAAAHAAGVMISAGTDTAAHDVTLPLELGRLVECGLSPLAAIQAATYNNALAMGLEHEIGSIEAGKRANLVVLPRNPGVNIEHLRDVAMVFKDGRAVDLP